MSSRYRSSLWNSYKTALEIAGKNAPLLRKSYLYFIISFAFQGLAFAFFYPLLEALFATKFILVDALFWFFIISICAIFSLIFRWRATYFSFSGDLVGTACDLRVKLGKKIKNMPLQKLYGYRFGELNSIITQNVDDSVLHMGLIAGIFFEATVVPIVVVVATFFISPALASMLFIALLLAFPIYKWYRGSTKLEKQENAKAYASLEADTIEYLQGLMVLKTLDQAGGGAKKLQKSIETLRAVQTKGVFASSIVMALMSSWIEFVFLSILAFGSFLIVSGELSIASLIALLVLLARVSEPLSLFLAVTSVLDIAEAGFKNIKKLLDTKELEIMEPSFEPKSFEICFENVSFAYENSQNYALKGVSFVIKENSLTAIIGASGSGKTTLTKLMMRYDDPLDGVIKIGGIDIRAIKTEDLMGYISVVFQDPYLFDDTIFNNIRFAKPDATSEEILEVAKKARVDEFVSKLPNGYDTKVGDVGASLSGGERQRISIARAMLKQSKIVILDEPTSALDMQNELAIQNALDELVKHKTVIVVAHRLSTISSADNILVMEDGKLVKNYKGSS